MKHLKSVSVLKLNYTILNGLAKMYFHNLCLDQWISHCGEIKIPLEYEYVPESENMLIKSIKNNKE